MVRVGSCEQIAKSAQSQTGSTKMPQNDSKPRVSSASATTIKGTDSEGAVGAPARGAKIDSGSKQQATTTTTTTGNEQQRPIYSISRLTQMARVSLPEGWLRM